MYSQNSWLVEPPYGTDTQRPFKGAALYTMPPANRFMTTSGSYGAPVAPLNSVYGIASNSQFGGGPIERTDKSILPAIRHPIGNGGNTESATAISAGLPGASTSLTPQPPNF